MKRQIHFETDEDREREIERDFNKHCLRAAAVILLFIGLLLLIGITKSHGQKIDNEVERHINHLMR